MSHPAYTAQEATSRDTFLALMWSLSYPGQVYPIPNGMPLNHIADTLLDIETSFYTPDEALVPYLQRNGARSLAPERAAYHFYPTLSDGNLDTIKEADIGTLMYPDRGATLIIGASIGNGQRLQLAGPGIKPSEPKTISVGNIPQAFWELREKAIRYPRGWDIYLVDGQQVMGLPRTTMITVKE